MKHDNKFYLQLSRVIFTEKYSTLSNNAKWLFVVLNELEQRYTGGNEDWFFRTDEELANDCNFSLSVLKRAKAELKKTDLVKVGKMHYKDTSTGKRSKICITSYEVAK